jgi:hypothetical protein
VKRLDGREFSRGVSTHSAHGKDSGIADNQPVQRSLNSWGVALTVSGEAILPVGTPEAGGVLFRSCWAQLQYNFTRKWQGNFARRDPVLHFVRGRV